MSDLIERLRTRNHSSIGFGVGPVCDEAAAELERLQAENERLRRGECICVKCGLRKDGEGSLADFYPGF